MTKLLENLHATLLLWHSQAMFNILKSIRMNSKHDFQGLESGMASEPVQKMDEKFIGIR